ncbi:hypothetical protein [Rhodovastum atsumiense]|uniref:Uncharacterized protein n=1 Tax=Rhodovastum atsumiense TaxID=504468 RepID=A0A5M6IXE8_9PROT|nr:hypothetical protein [Rhodovastum atsumiense]KAA5613010.1 hypothetical protein F1189_06505 [Rhodovastum atsumiense]
MKHELRAALCGVAAAGILFIAAPAAAQGPAPGSRADTPTAPPSKNEGSMGGDAGRPQGGVITPPAHVDPDIARQPPPDTRFPLPVIPPPGTPGGDQSVRPK